MEKLAIAGLVIGILRETFAIGLEIAELVMSDEDIKDSALYEAMPKDRKITVAKLWREAQKAQADGTD